jgi:hypothetical protein
MAAHIGKICGNCLNVLSRRLEFLQDAKVFPKKIENERIPTRLRSALPCSMSSPQGVAGVNDLHLRLKAVLLHRWRRDAAALLPAQTLQEPGRNASGQGGIGQMRLQMAGSARRGIAGKIALMTSPGTTRPPPVTIAITPARNGGPNPE